jgi:hypothetical protein
LTVNCWLIAATALQKKNSFFLNDRCVNVYENKRLLWKSGAEAGIYMKTGTLMLFNRKSTRTSLRIPRRTGSTASWRIRRGENSIFERATRECLRKQRAAAEKCGETGNVIENKEIIRLKPECM